MKEHIDPGTSMEFMQFIEARGRKRKTLQNTKMRKKFKTFFDEEGWTR